MKAYLRANCPIWHCQIWRVLFFLVLAYWYSQNLICPARVLHNKNFNGPIWHGLLHVANQILLGLIHIDLSNRFNLFRVCS